MREWKPFHPDCLPQSRTRWLSRDPAPSNKTISVRRMPAQVCWRPPFTHRLSPAHLHNPCDTAINNSAVICISVPEIEDRHAHKHGPAGDVNRVNREYGGGGSSDSITLRQTVLTVCFLPLQTPILVLNPPQNNKWWENLTFPADVPSTNCGGSRRRRTAVSSAQKRYEGRSSFKGLVFASILTPSGRYVC